MTTAGTPILARGIVRCGPDSRMPITAWRRGPETPDGYRMVTTGRAQPWAVRVVIDPDADDLGGLETHFRLENALNAPAHEREDAYLAAPTVVSLLPKDDLTRLRDAVRAGETGGAADGAPKRRTRKVADR